MLTRSACRAMRNLLRWAERPDWQDMEAQVYAEHVDPAIAFLDLPEEEMQDLVEPAWELLDVFIVEDFLSARFGEEGELNVIDEYLKRRGWREPVPARRYLAALRDSSPSLYEVVEIDPGRNMRLKDLVGQGGTITVEERERSKVPVRWDHLAGRVVSLNDSLHLTGGILPFASEMSRELSRVFDDAVKEVRREIRKERGKAEAQALSREQVLECVPRGMFISFSWLLQMVAGELEIRNAGDGRSCMAGAIA